MGLRNSFLVMIPSALRKVGLSCAFESPLARALKWFISDLAEGGKAEFEELDFVGFLVSDDRG
jgi:hypothetical protein